VRALEGSLISLAALLGTDVKDSDGRTVGRLADVVVRWEKSEMYPSVSSVVIRTGHNDLVVGGHWVTVSSPNTVRLRSSAARVRAPERRPTEVALAHDVLDRQVVDAEGVQIVRPSDVYLAPMGDRVELIGIEIGAGALLRRLGPKRLRSGVRPQRVIDWATIQGFSPARSDGMSPNGHRSQLAGRAGAGLVLDASAGDVRRLHASEVQAALEAAQRSGAGESR
jgi:sporulation protein YlmC with PRC-barrel domain